MKPPQGGRWHSASMRKTMKQLKTVREAGIKIIGNTDDYSEWLLAMAIYTNSDWIEIANLITIEREVDEIGEGYELVQTPFGRAIIIPPDSTHAKAAVEDLLVRAEHGVINEVDLAVVADSATFHAWTVMPIFQRIAYCQAAQAHIAWALRAPPPPHTQRSLRVLVENHARTNDRLGGIEF